LRKGQYTRETKETKIIANVNLDGTGIADVKTGIYFLDHMITSLSTHSLIDIKLNANGDLKHHIVEDTAIVLGIALYEALQVDKRIKRFSDSTTPMDESLATCSIDLGGRSYHVIDLDLSEGVTEDIKNEDITHFLETFAISLRANIHITVKYGANDHHKTEAAFKALARCLREASTIDMRRTDSPSSKGTI
jgi:imidazoleglycerol-phosphate dehydratase